MKKVCIFSNVLLIIVSHGIFKTRKHRTREYLWFYYNRYSDTEVRTWNIYNVQVRDLHHMSLKVFNLYLYRVSECIVSTSAVLLRKVRHWKREGRLNMSLLHSLQSLHLYLVRETALCLFTQCLAPIIPRFSNSDRKGKHDDRKIYGKEIHEIR